MKTAAAIIIAALILGFWIATGLMQNQRYTLEDAPGGFVVFDARLGKIASVCSVVDLVNLRQHGHKSGMRPTYSCEEAE